MPLAVRITTMHPVKLYGIHVAVGVGMMQVILVAIINSIALVKLHTELEGRGFTKASLYGFIISHRVISYLFLSFWPPLTMLILGTGTDVITPDVFFSWWALLWVSKMMN